MGSITITVPMSKPAVRPHVASLRLEIVGATRLTAEAFFRESALGRSLPRLQGLVTVANIRFENSLGLSEVYNDAIDSSQNDAILLFVHDDVWLEDFFLPLRLVDALQQFDIVGVAGNKRRLPRQPSWAFRSVGSTLEWDADEQLSGAVAHGKDPAGPVGIFGPSPQACELLDGLFLAARRSVLKERGVRFDPAFRFHFYDMDFCRTARHAGLRLGTWPIAVTHQSVGAFNTPAWREGLERYLAKWGE